MVQWPLNGRLLFSELPGHLPLTGWGKNRFLGPTLNFDRTCICATEHDINNRKETCQSTGTPLHALKFDELWFTYGWQRLASFCPPSPYIFALGDTASLTAWTLYDGQQANFGTCYVVARAYSLEQQNAGRAQAGLCHASSCV